MKKFKKLLITKFLVVFLVLTFLTRDPMVFAQQGEITEAMQKYTLTVYKETGINGTPASGSTEYEKDTTVNYSYSLQAGYSELNVLLGGIKVSSSGSIKMDRNHTLTATTTQLGSIRVTSTPGSAAVWLDGTDTGKRTTAVLNNITPGSHTVKLVKTGYNDYNKTVTVTSGQQVTVNATLIKFDSGVIWINIPAGNFKMGDNFNEGSSDERPVHRVYLDTYYISKYEVTFDQYDKFCESTGRSKPSDSGWGRGSRPVSNVSWDDARAYCDWLSSNTGQNIHLPTEAQWEKAARGTDQRRYPWGNSSPNCSKANYSGCGGKTKSVGSHPSGVSPYGVHDMAGNVTEWCSDWYSSSYYSSSPANNPTGPSSGSDRVLRGGSWCSNARFLRSAYRGLDTPSYHDFILGFRLCRD